MDDMALHLFDRDADVSIQYRRLPHWSQAGAITFITWRTEDSMPDAVRNEWFDDRRRWLTKFGIDISNPDWDQRLMQLHRKLQNEFRTHFWNRWHDALDAGHGACVLQQPNLSKIVADSLQHSDGQNYLILDYVVMPNHVHLLVAFPDERGMLNQCESWKRFTARKIHCELNESGGFWQSDGFDHLVRSEEQLWYLRRYIRDNPKKARLAPSQFRYYSKVLE